MNVTMQQYKYRYWLLRGDKFNFITKLSRQIEIWAFVALNRPLRSVRTQNTALCVNFIKRPFRIFKTYTKLESTMDMLNVFLLNEWKFDNCNTRELWSRLGQEDRETFRYGLDEFDWPSYINDYVRGIRKHLLRERQWREGSAGQKPKASYRFVQ